MQEKSSQGSRRVKKASTLNLFTGLANTLNANPTIKEEASKERFNTYDDEEPKFKFD